MTQTQVASPETQVPPPETQAPPPGVRMLQMLTGFWTTQMLSVAARLGLADHVREGPRTAGELAAATGADGPTLYRLLRGLAGMGVFAEDETGRFGLTPLAETLRSDVPGTLRYTAMMYGLPMVWRSWGDLTHSVTTGAAAGPHVFGRSLWEYLPDQPEEAACFNAYMTGISEMQAAAILGSYDFSPYRTVVDVGGGHGSLLAAVLGACPAARGVLLDLPDVVAGARAVDDFGVVGRCQVMGGDFFTAVPEGGDAYLLKMILHDWDDDQAARILRNVRAAMDPAGRVLVMDTVVPAGNTPHFSKLLDLHMLVLAGGRERTEAEFRDLFRAAGLELTRIVPTPSPLSIVEGRRA